MANQTDDISVPVLFLMSSDELKELEDQLLSEAAPGRSSPDKHSFIHGITATLGPDPDLE